MFVREDSVIPQSLVKHFIDKKRNLDSLKKLMTTGYLTFESRASLMVCIRHACNYYNYSKWPAELNVSTLEYFAQCMTWITADNTATAKDYRAFLRGFAVLLRALVLDSIETYWKVKWMKEESKFNGCSKRPVFSHPSVKPREICIWSVACRRQVLREF